MADDFTLEDLSLNLAKTFQSAILITGGYGGIGLECVKFLVAARPDTLIIIVGRNAQAAHDAACEIGSNVVGVGLDLADLDAVAAFTRTFVARTQSGTLPPVETLICNAAAQSAMGQMNATKAGLERTFAVNHVGHHLLATGLIDAFAPKGRLIVVASGVHDPETTEGRMNKPVLMSASDLADPAIVKDKGMNAMVVYATSKLCNLLFAYEFDRRIPVFATNKTIEVFAFDPGGVPATGLMRDTSRILRTVIAAASPIFRVMGVTIRSPEAAGRDLANLVTVSPPNTRQASYWKGASVGRSSTQSYDEEAAALLWEETEELIRRKMS